MYLKLYYQNVVPNQVMSVGSNTNLFFEPPMFNDTIEFRLRVDCKSFIDTNTQVDCNLSIMLSNI